MPELCTDCPHTDRPNFRNGKCQWCYRKYRENNNSVKATKCLHTDRPHVAKGMCGPCYRTQSAKSRKPADCHPDRPMYARGMCGSCYNVFRVNGGISGSRKADCHPDRVHYGRGKCKECHHRELDEKTYRFSKYNIDKQQFLQMLQEQNNCCAICSKDFADNSPNVDHDHKTGLVRGLLCRKCNTALGLFADDIDSLRAAIDYLCQNSKKGR